MSKIKYKKLEKVNVSLVNSDAINKPSFIGNKLQAQFKSSVISQDIVVFNKGITFSSVNWAKNQLFGSINTQEPSNKDLSFYRHKKITLPRDKFALLKDKLNWSVTRNDSNADYHIISKNLLQSTVECSWTDTFIYGKEYIKCIKELEALGIITEDTLIELEYQYKGEPYAYVINSYWYNNYGHNTPQKKTADAVMSQFNKVVSRYAECKTFIVNDDINQETETFYKESSCNLKEEKAFIEFLNPTKSYVLDEYIVNMCNADSPVLKFDDFDMIKNLLKSNDKDDAAMAVNVLANCNIEKSLDIVSYFFVFYHGWMRESSIWNSVNVKSMRKALSDLDHVAGYNHTNSYAYDALVKFLIKNNSLTEFIFKKIAARITNKYTKIFFNKAGVFKIPEIELKDNWKESIISYPLNFDNVPEIDVHVKENDLPF